MASDELLTEGELDALMESVDDGASTVDASDDGEYRRFDFTAREQSLLREFTTLPSLLERQAEALAKALESAFSIEFNVTAEAPALQTVNDTLAGLEKLVAVTSTTLSPLAGSSFAVSPASLLSFAVNAYFGGRSISAPANTERGPLTPTELRIAERINQIGFVSLVETWSDKLPLEADEMQTLGVADRLEALPRSEQLLQLQFTLSVDENKHRLRLLLPFASLEPYRVRFAPPKKSYDLAGGVSWEPFFRRELPVIELEVAGVLATRTIALADLLELREGAVLPIPAPASVVLQVEDLTLGEGRYGSHEGNKAVQLERLAKQQPSTGQ
jgi:flagellar motor switch protein FliM